MTPNTINMIVDGCVKGDFHFKLQWRKNYGALVKNIMAPWTPTGAVASSSSWKIKMSGASALQMTWLSQTPILIAPLPKSNCGHCGGSRTLKSRKMRNYVTLDLFSRHRRNRPSIDPISCGLPEPVLVVFLTIHPFLVFFSRRWDLA